jgi:hypothetical protein
MIEETERWLRRSEAVRGSHGQDWLDVRYEADKESLKEIARTLSERLKQVAQVSDKMSEEQNRVRRSRNRRA